MTPSVTNEAQSLTQYDETMTRLRGVLDVRDPFIRPCIYKVTSLPPPSLTHLLTTNLLTNSPTAEGTRWLHRRAAACVVARERRGG